jgi:hypothetical protein
MPEEYDPRKLPVVIDIAVGPESISPEFTEETSGTSEHAQVTKPPSKTRYWPSVLIAGALAAAVYVIYFRPSPDAVRSTRLPENPGWDDLSPCSDASSLDGTMGLGLLSDGRATLYDNTPIKGSETTEDHTTNGAWHFDELSRRYSITFKGASTDYLVVSSEQTKICMLIKGDLGAADLRASWFSGASDDEPPADDRD